MPLSTLSSRFRLPLLGLFLVLASFGLGAQDLPITKVSLFSSGVGYFEHRGLVKGDATVSLSFTTAEVDDALKSLVIWDNGAGASSPSVSYPSLEGLDEALKGLRVDLTGGPKVADLLVRLKGAELAVNAPSEIVGRIVSVEPRPTGKDGSPRTTVVLLTASGLQAIALDDMTSFRFTDPELASDFARGLSLILGGRDADRRVLSLRLPGSASREVAFGYIVAAPVWKASYRLDLSGDKPFFQGWAIVDNPSQVDWKDVTLTLVSGRPVSFIQHLYAPLRLGRPVQPLSIAGIAQAQTYESGMDLLAEESDSFYADEAPAMMASKAAPAPAPMAKRAEAPSGGVRGDLASGLGSSQWAAEAQTATRAAGDQFEFTVKKPVTLERRRSAMLPLVAGPMTAEKVSIWSPDSGSPNPMLGVRLTNSMGMKLPAGPISVFDGGTYAGDALIEFLPEKDKRLLVYGQDLSVTAATTRASSQETVGVTVSKGVMVFSKRTTWTRTYEVKNAAATARKLVIEHPITAGAELMAPTAFDEKTETVYRFPLALAPASQAKLEVKERSPSQERVVLSSLASDSFLYYASSSEIPAKVKDALRKAIDLRKKADDAKKALAELTSRRSDLSTEQGRIRQNLDAVGRDSTQGQQYLKRLMDSETELDSLASRITEARKASQEAQGAYDAYLGNLSIE